MADNQNIIEVIIRGSLEGANLPEQYKQQLLALSKQGASTSELLNQLTKSVAKLNTELGDTEASREFTQSIITGAKQAAVEFDKSSRAITAGGTQAANTLNVLNSRSLGVNRALGLAASALADLGPAGQIASNALVQVITSGARLTLGRRRSAPASASLLQALRY